MIGYSIRAERKKKLLNETVKKWCRDIDWLIREYDLSLERDYFETLWGALEAECNIKNSDATEVHDLIGHLVYDVLDEKIQERLLTDYYNETFD